MTDFDRFKKAFTKYQQRFGLIGYQVYIQQGPIDGAFATIASNQNQMVATVTLSNNLHKENKPFKHITRTAKHEAIHLMIERLVHLARCRYVNEEEIDEAGEELTVKLETLLPD